MASLMKITLTGKSGTEYKFDVYPKEATLEAFGAVYALTSRVKMPDKHFIHTIPPTYIGQTGDLSKCFCDHHQEECFESHPWNCICVHRDDNEASRLKKESDLIEYYKPICNQQ
jgi:hypothetical protein